MVQCVLFAVRNHSTHLQISGSEITFPLRDRQSDVLPSDTGPYHLQSPRAEEVLDEGG